MKNEIKSASALAEANQLLVDWFTLIAYSFSLSDPVTVALYG
jgi:hypothetical protein